MFTGIIEELGKIQDITSSKVIIECVTVLEDAKLGDSIAVNGVCLTITNLQKNSFTADISPETFQITSLKNLKKDDTVNLERAMKADGRFGGHMVSGHIDGQAKFISLKKDNNFYELVFELESNLENYTVKKGSIAINGISLTIAKVDSNTIKIAIIPHTYENNNLKSLKKGDFVNIEVDIIAKYIEKFLSTRDNESRISLEFLQEHGF